jgi:hypothetical protein
MNFNYISELGFKNSSQVSVYLSFEFQKFFLSSSHLKKTVLIALLKRLFLLTADTMLSESIMAKCIFDHDEITGVIKDLE